MGTGHRPQDSDVASMRPPRRRVRLLPGMRALGVEALRPQREAGERVVCRTVAFSILYARVWDQRRRDRRGPGWSATADQRLLNFLKVAAIFVLPEVLALVLFLVSWLRNFLEKTNWRILYVITWWFYIQHLPHHLRVARVLRPRQQVRCGRAVDSTVVLIYLMDIQIWYAIFSSPTSALVGLFSYLGSSATEKREEEVEEEEEGGRERGRGRWKRKRESRRRRRCRRRRISLADDEEERKKRS